MEGIGVTRPDRSISPCGAVKGSGQRRDVVVTRFRSLSSRPARPIVPKGHYRDH